MRRPLPVRHRPLLLISAVLAMLGTVLALSWPSGPAAARPAAVPAYQGLTIPLAVSTGILNSGLAARLARLDTTAIDATTAGPQLYTVRAGDTLAGIARAKCADPAMWTGIYAASRQAHQTARDANVLTAGQKLTIQCYRNPGMAGRAAAPAPVQAAPVQLQAPVQAAAVSRGTSSSYSGYRSGSRASTVTYAGSGSMQSCIIARESGGNAGAVNPSSGAGGLYQFLPSTWAALGHSGLPENASVTEQTQAFHQEVAQSGYSAWQAYDGC